MATLPWQGLEPLGKRVALVHCQQRSGDTGISQATKKDLPIDDGLCDQPYRHEPP